MTQFIVETHDERKTKLLLQLLRQLDFVDSVKKVRQVESQHFDEADDANDFFAMAGIWSDREISIDTIRQQAWPDRTS